MLCVKVMTNVMLKTKKTGLILQSRRACLLILDLHHRLSKSLGRITQFICRMTVGFR